MKRIKQMIIVFFGLAIINGCSKEEITKIELRNQSYSEFNLDDDLTCDATTDSTIGQVINNSIAANLLRTNNSFEDSDNDGIADYAEANIAELDPNRYDDIKVMNPGTILTVSTVNGVKEIPLYTTSIYHDGTLGRIGMSFDEESPWTSIQKERITYSFKKVKKFWLTPDFYKYVSDKFSEEKSTDFFYKMITATQDVKFKHSPRAAGTSNGIAIGIAPWVLAKPTLLPSGVSHELVHHIGIRTHNGIPHGTQKYVAQSIAKGKADYKLVDINKKTDYINPCIPVKPKKNSGYHSIKYLKIPNTSIEIHQTGGKIYWKGDYHVYSTPVTFTRGQTYESITKFLNGGKYSIWIDFNDDAVFDDNERLLNNVWVRSNMEEKRYNFSIPENANRGVHRLRIVKSNFALAESCSYKNRGQALDFKNVTIQ